MIELFTNPSPEYIRNNILWRVQLNTEEIIYQNDYITDRYSWLNLKHYLDENRDKHITSMHLMFRDHYEHIGSNKNFFFFTFKLLAHTDGYTQHYYVAGCGDDANEIKCKHFRTPELLVFEEDVRNGYSSQCNRGIIAHPFFIDSFENYYHE